MALRVGEETMQTLQGKRILVMGLGAFGGGAGAARFCAEQGARVTVTDLRTESQLADSLRLLEGLPIRFRLGGHDAGDFSQTDLVVVSPAVDRRHNAFLDAARKSGAVLTSEIELLLERIDRGRVIGVTGSAGKSTTVAMIGHILKAALGDARVHVGGNIGGSLLGELAAIRPEDWVVLELSSFMLESMFDWSPHVAVVTNLTNNHLDRHGTIAAYTAAKQRILDFQRPGDESVLGPGLPPEIHPRTRHHTILRLPENGFPKLPIPGDHNRLNALLAIQAARCAGVRFDSDDQAEKILQGFKGLPHRLELICEHKGVRFFNDSKATTPEAAILALDAFEPGIVHAILGGSDKHADLTPLARHAARRSAALYTIGQTGDRLADAAGTDGSAVHRCGTLPVAMDRAFAAARAGDVVLLSPGCASYDQFSNFQERGGLFRELALRYTRHS